MTTRQKKTVASKSAKAAGDTGKATQAKDVHIVDEFSDDSDLSHGLQVNSDAKLVFIDLNNRLANYIEKVRSLEIENAQLALKIREFELEYRNRETNTSEYKIKNDDLRRQLENANALRIRAEVEKKKFEAEAVTLREQYEKNERDLKYAADDREKLQERLSRTKNDLNLAEAALHKVEREKGSLKTDLNMVLKQQDVLKAQLEDETILRNELQACIDGELSTYNSLLESEENRLHISTGENSEISPKDLSAGASGQQVRPAPAVIRTTTATATYRSGVATKRQKPDDFFDFTEDDH